ncbi:hypothetical protein [Halorientalis regularis]|uniref:Uncharacterized protein n=1 Tax=Halorientalis regularis TaxID=660518 RepID=A0A1G7QBL0_9EURY|nr:hypothetical protein [Halorientalis regularis]SDF95883.1 hypothetical protein SAMN05216218_11271 [Halorientalis regularis]
MVVALLGLLVVAFAAACGIAVYRTGRRPPVFRALVTFGILLLTPVIVFALLSTTLTSALPVFTLIPVLVFLGLGLYTIAEGSFPSPIQNRLEAQ